MILPLLWVLLLGAQNTVYFDFSPRPFQQGEYQISANVSVDAASARLVEVDDWHLTGWSARLEFFVENASSVQLEEYPVLVDLSRLPPELFDLAAIDGADLRVVDADGVGIGAMWVENFDFIARTGELWLQLPTLPTGQTRIYLYFGNEAAPPTGSWQDVFSWSSLRYGAWWPFPGTSQVSVAALEPVRVQIGAASPVDATSAPTVFSAEPGVVAANGPYSLAGDLDMSDIAVPFSMAGTAFTFAAQRGTDVLEVFSPFGVAQVQLLQGETLLAEATVGQLQAEILGVDVPTGAYRLISDNPVVAFHRTLDGNDGHPLVPAAPELWGAALGTVYVTTLEDDTTLTVHRSDIVTTTHTLQRDVVLTLSYGATAGDGPALHLIADKPVGALSQADGSGGESVAFLPRRNLGRDFVLPRAVTYLALAATAPSTVCATFQADGTPGVALTSEATPPPFPNKLRFGALAAGTRVACSAPVVAFQEDAALGDERHLPTVKDHRPFVHPEPAMEAAGQVAVSRFDPGPGNVTTPELVVPHRITRWEGIEFLDPTIRPEGTSLRFEVSTDAGATWQIFDGLSWVPSTGEGMEPGYLVGGFPELPANRSLTLRSTLTGDGGATPVLGPMAVTYRYDEGAASLRFAPVQGPQTQGVPFPVTVEALDEQGSPLAGYDEPLLLSAGAVRLQPTRHEGFLDGRATFWVVVLDAGEAVTLIATDGSASAVSDPFEVLPTEADRLEKVSGDGQWGWEGEPLPHPLVVRLLDAEGQPLAAHRVTFTADAGRFEGDDDGVTELDTGFSGYAAVTFVPARGANVVTVTHEGLDPVTFTVRGDERDPKLHDAGGSTACSARPGRPGAPITALPLAFLLLSLFLLRRSRRVLR